MERVLIGLPLHLHVKVVDDIGSVLSLLGAIHSLARGHVTSLAHNLLILATALEIVICSSMNYVRHCHSVF